MSFHRAVLPFSLAIALRVEGIRELLFDAQEVAQGGPKLEREYWAAVANNGVGQTVMSNYNIEDNFC